MNDKPKDLNPETLAQNIRALMSDDNIVPYTHYMIVNQALYDVLIQSSSYIVNYHPLILANPAPRKQKFTGSIHGLWIMVDDKVIEMTIKPIDTLD
jgi:hypothetical protein